MFLSQMFQGPLGRAWQPGVTLASPANPLGEVQEWIRTATAKEDRFLAPFPDYAVDQPDFRAMGERPFLVTLADAQEVAFNVGAEKSVTERMQACLKGRFSAVLEGKVGFLERGRLYREAYASNTEEDFLRLAQKYSLDYIVTEKPHRLSWGEVFENERYCVYRVRGGAEGSGR